MRALVLALRGVLWRRWSSLAIVVVAVACAAVATAGPAFGADARDAVLQQTLRHTRVDADGSGATVTVADNGDVLEAAFALRIERAFGGLVDARRYLPPVLYQEGLFVYAGGPGPKASLPVTYRADACAHLRIVSGHCVAEARPDDVVVTEQTAVSERLRVGSTISIGNDTGIASVRVAGVYAPRQPDGPYWFGRSHRYFGQVALTHGSRGDAVLTASSFWTPTTSPDADEVRSGADLALVPGRLHIGNLPSFRSGAATAVSLVEGPFSASRAPIMVTSALPTILARADTASRAALLPILIIAGQLLVLTWLVLYLVLVSSAESRSDEIVLGKLRGLTPRETLLHALLEPLVLIVAAVPLGVAICDLVLRAVGPSVLGPGVQTSLPVAAWLAGIGAALGGIVASLLASVGVLRRSILSQWRRTQRRPGRGSWVPEVLVAALAAAGFADLATSTGTQSGLQFVPAIAPGLLAVACALLGVRVLPLLARATFRATRGSRRVGVFVAVRQLGRRTGDLRVFVLLTVAVALFVFGIASRTVFDVNRHERAVTETGASRVLGITSAPGVDPAAVIERLDPSGRLATAVFQGPLGVQIPAGPFDSGRTTTTPTVLVVDPVRFAAVAHWRPDFGTAGSLARQLRPLRARAPFVIRFRATSIRVTARARITADLPVQLILGLIGVTGRAIVPVFGSITPVPRYVGPRTVSFTAAVPQCAAGCTLRRIGLRRTGVDASPTYGSLQLTTVDAVSSVGTRSLVPALRASHWSSQDDDTTGVAAERASTDQPGLTVFFAPDESPDSQDNSYGVISDVPSAVPALVTSTLLSRTRPHRLTAVPGQGSSMPLSVSPVSVLPRSGDAGAVIPQAWLPAARPYGYERYLPNQIWLDAQAPADFQAELAAAGIVVRQVQTASARAAALNAQGPSYAVDMLLLGAIAAGALAVAGASASLLVASRRRLYELAAMRSLGVTPARLLGSLILEQGVIAVVAAAVGVGAGLVGTRVALHRLPEFADVPRFPALLVQLPVLLCVALVLGVVALVLLAAAAGGSSLVRQASPSRLREAQN